MSRNGGTTRPTAPPGAPRPSSIEQPWRLLSEEIRGCRKCRLHATRTQAVVYRGSLTPKVLFVGEAPGSAEDRVGIPFVGRSGRHLDAAVARLGLTPEEFGVLNVLKCRPPGNRFDPGAARTCRPYLDRQIALLDPEVLVTLGSHALHALAPDAPSVLLAAGRPRSRGERPIFPLIHPAAAMRSRRLLARWTHDVAELHRWLAHRRAQPV